MTEVVDPGTASGAMQDAAEIMTTAMRGEPGDDPERYAAQVATDRAIEYSAPNYSKTWYDSGTRQYVTVGEDGIRRPASEQDIDQVRGIE